MSPLILVLLAIVIVVCVFGYPMYRNNADKRAREKKRNQFHDRI
ncbi:MAG TPA: hypothetical protein VNG51_21700 [Ktedonobacteraceae bacterium]|nr:hypothetical protein [Ktedonobacteraceae bacterium]